MYQRLPFAPLWPSRKDSKILTCKSNSFSTTFAILRGASKASSAKKAHLESPSRMHVPVNPLSNGLLYSNQHWYCLCFIDPFYTNENCIWARDIYCESQIKPPVPTRPGLPITLESKLGLRSPSGRGSHLGERTSSCLKNCITSGQHHPYGHGHSMKACEAGRPWDCTSVNYTNYGS